MNAESKQTLRNVAGVVALRVLETLGSVLLVTLVPKRMGAEEYGQFSLLLSVSLWFSLLSGMGNASVLTRYTPEFVERKDLHGLAKLVSRLLVLRCWGGLGAGASFLVLMLVWLRDIDAVAGAIVAVSVLMRAAANLPFALLLGLNQAARWAVSEVLRRGLLAPVALLGYSMDGLRGVCWGMLGLEVLVFVVGMWWTREYFEWKELRFDRAYIAPYAKFSFAFVIGNLMLALTTRIGGPLVKALEGSYADVAQFSVAYGMYLAGAFGLASIYTAAGAKLSAMQIRGDRDGVRRWVSWMLGASGGLSLIVAALVFLTGGELLEHMLGPQYRGLGRQVEVLCLAGVLTAPGMLARVVTVSLGEGELNARGSVLQLVLFVLVSAALFPWLGVLSVAWGVVAGTVGINVLMSLGLRESGVFPMAGWLQLMAIGAVAAPVLWVESLWWPERWMLFSAVVVAGMLRSYWKR